MVLVSRSQRKTAINYFSIRLLYFFSCHFTAVLQALFVKNIKSKKKKSPSVQICYNVDPCGLYMYIFFFFFKVSGCDLYSGALNSSEITVLAMQNVMKICK